MRMAQALADVSTHDAKMTAFTLNTKENSVESEAMQGESCCKHVSHVCSANCYSRVQMGHH